jgi:hypothetical protein
MTVPEQLSVRLSEQQRFSTVAEINKKIAAERLQYRAAYLAGHDGEAEYLVYEIARLENLRNIVQRQNIA